MMYNFQLFDLDFKQEEKHITDKMSERFGESVSDSDLTHVYKDKDQRTKTVTRAGLTRHLRREGKQILEYQC